MGEITSYKSCSFSPIFDCSRGTKQLKNILDEGVQVWCMPLAYHSGCIHRGVFLEDWGPRGWGTLIFSYRRRLGSFLGFKILNFIIFGSFQKK